MNIGQQHIHARKRLFKHLEPFPSRQLGKRILDYVIYVAAIAQPLALVPQAVLVLSDGHAAGASPLTWSLLGVIGIMWILYGLVHKEKPIVLSNALSVVLDFVIVYGIMSH
jgi:MtN3 and saliva related transmembrane protein